MRTVKKRKSNLVEIRPTRNRVFCMGGCGYEFKLLTAMKLKPAEPMFCLPCQRTRTVLKTKMRMMMKEIEKDVR